MTDRQGIRAVVARCTGAQAWDGRRGVPHHAPPASASATLEALARRLVQLCPDRRDPERFHMDKSELAAELRRLARALAA